MPTYTYQCSDCGVSFEQFQKFSEEPLTNCRTCAGSVRRVIHPVGVVFRGSGWYINDSRKSSTESTTATESTSSTESAKSDPVAKEAAPVVAEPSPAAKPAEAKVAD